MSGSWPQTHHGFVFKGSIKEPLDEHVKKRLKVNGKERLKGHWKELKQKGNLKESLLFQGDC